VHRVAGLDGPPKDEYGLRDFVAAVSPLRVRVRLAFCFHLSSLGSSSIIPSGAGGVDEALKARDFRSRWKLKFSTKPTRRRSRGPSIETTRCVTYLLEMDCGWTVSAP
jgi:hypothetical protein